nr:MAG TPA: antirepressor [Caudoviricetes sp.]
MSNNMRTESWCGHEIRFVEINGEWYAILKDICDALRLRSKDISQRLDPDMMERVPVEGERNRPTKYKENYEDGSNDVVNSKNTFWMLAVNELGIYEALFASRKLEARKFRRWSATVMKKLRQNVGLQGYEVMKMTDKDIQDEIDWILDSLYWDDEKKCVMQSYTVQGGDVEQRVYCK